MYPLKFEPILKQTLWGGDKIIPFKHLNDTLPNVGESWEVSAVDGSESVVANGPDKGLTLPDMVRKYKEELVGESNYARFGTKFPLLIKFIDARLDLSIQVHPDDTLASKRHNSFGKNEMWYVIAADKGAKLISGFAKEITPKEYKERVHDGTFAEVLQTCNIQPGDVFDYPAGAGHVYNLATQYSWKPEARLDYIAASLQRMCELATADGVGQIALPAIGAGLGGLDWKEVRLIVEQVGEKYPEIHLYVVEHYSPGQGFPGRRS